MKRGFTLIELLATVTLLGLLVIIVYPKVTEQFKNQKNNLTDAKKKLIYSGTNDYLNDHEDLYPIRENKIYCIPLSTLIDEQYVVVDVSDIDKTLIVKFIITDTKSYDLVKYDKCVEA